MRAYILPKNDIIAPLERTGSQLLIGGRPVADISTENLYRAGFQINRIQSSDEISGPCIIVSDDILISFKAAKSLMRVPARAEIRQISLPSMEFLPIQHEELRKDFKKVEIWTIPQEGKFDQKENYKTTKLHLAPKYYTTKINLPYTIYGITAAHIKFNQDFIYPIRQWPDFLVGQSLFARQLAAQKYEQICNWIPNKWQRPIFEWSRLARFSNQISPDAKIHPTAIIEASIIESGAEIGPYSYIRSSYVGKNTQIREYSTIKLSTIEGQCLVMSSDLFNSYLGKSSVLFTQMFHNSILGDNAFLGAASGFSDFDFRKNSVDVIHGNERTPTEMRFLGGCIGPHSKIGAGVIFRSGATVPARTNVVNPNMIDSLPNITDLTCVAKGTRLIPVPQQLIPQE